VNVDDSDVLYFLCHDGINGPVKKFNGAVTPPTLIGSITLSGHGVDSQYAFAVAPNGEMWATSDSSGVVFRKYSSTGAFTGVTFTFPGSSFVYISVVDKNNNLWGTDIFGPVRQYSPQGVLLTTLTDIGNAFGFVLAGGPLPSQRNPFNGVYVGSSVPNPDQVVLFSGSSCTPTSNPTRSPTRNPTP
jgi:hypothetical protein